MVDSAAGRRVALVTGGTKGLGKAIGLELARHGDQVILTYGWGSVDEDDVLRDFAEAGCVPPLLRQADVINADDTAALAAEVAERFGRLDILVSNVSFANLVGGIDDYAEAALLKSIEYSTWPMVAYLQALRAATGHFPRYVLALSSHGPDRFHKNYDFAAAAKAVTETLVKYLTYHFFEQEVIFNVVRTRPILTDSLLATLGPEWAPFIAKYDVPGTAVEPREIGRLVVAMCSGLMDAVRGQTITADRGYDFGEGLQRLYVDRDALGL